MRLGQSAPKSLRSLFSTLLTLATVSSRGKSNPRHIRPDRRSIANMQLEDLETRVLMAGAPARLILELLPSPLTAVGSTPNPPIKVTVADVTGATVTTDASTVLLTLFQNPAGGSLTVGGRAVGSVTATAVGGIATFTNLSFSVAGQYVINANDGALAGTQSNVFTVLAVATHLAYQVQPGNINAGGLFSPAVQVLVEDASNNVVTTDSRAISLSLNLTTGSLTGTTTVNAQNGVATFTGVSVTTLGTYTLTARDNATSGALTSASSLSFTVSAGAPAKVVFGQSPVNTPLGSILPPVIVNVTDVAGNIVTTDNSAVTLAINSYSSSTFVGTPVITGTVTVNAVNGVATFNDLSFADLGNYKLQASDGALAIGVSNSFAITGAPAKLAFGTQPSQTTVGTVMSPSITVAVVDVNGNVVGTDNSSVALVIGSGPGTISGTTTVAAVNGIATFSGLSFSQMGTLALTASDGTLTTANSNSFIINGTAAQLAFLVQPAAPSANVAITPPVVIVVEDINGNRVLNDASTVTINLHTGPGALSGTTGVTAVNGLATFSNLKLSLAGTYTLAAASTGLSGAISNSFIVLPAASQLAFIIQPTDVAASAVMYPATKVQVQNTLGQAATTNTSSVTLSLVSGPQNGSIGGTTTVAAIAGVATFSNLTFSVQGSYILMASDGLLATDISQAFYVGPPAFKVEWGAKPVGTVAAGTVLPPITLVVEDINGHYIYSDHSVVTLTIASGPTGATIVGNATANPSQGIAVFSNVSFSKAGAYTLTATDGALRSPLAKPCNVVPDAASAHLSVSQSAVTTLVASQFPVNVYVNIIDNSSNIVSDGSAITLSVLSGPGGTLAGTTTVNARFGVATFDNLSLNLAGTYVLSAVDPSLANATPATFVVTVNPVNTLVGTPALARSYEALMPLTLSARLQGLVAAPVAWSGSANLVDAANNVLASAPVNAAGDVTFTNVPGFLAGDHTLRIRYLGDTNHLASVSPPFVLSVVSSTLGSIDAAGPALLSGWVADRDIPATAIAFQVNVDGAVFYTGTAALARPDLAAVIGGANHGFSVDLSSLTPGLHRVDLFAADRTSGASLFIASRTFSSDRAPIGSIDVFSSTLLAGWAADPSNFAASIQVVYQIDAQAPVIVNASGNRSDLTSFLGSAAHGYAVSLPQLPAGMHTAAVWAVDSTSNARTSLGSLTLTVTDPAGNALPFGAVDVLTAATVNGWAFDPTAPGASINVRVDVDGVAGTPFLANGNRADLASALNGTTFGFTHALTLSAGAHRIDVYALDSTTATPVLLASRIVTPATGAGAGAPVGALDAATSTIQNGAAFAGWAYASAFAGTTATVRLDIDGLAGAAFTTSVARTDLNTALGVGTYGFSITAPALAPGTHTVALVYLDPLTLAATTVATKSLTVPAPGPLAGTPMGALDIVTSANLAGWVYSSAFAAATATFRLDIDGSAGATLTTSIARADLTSVLGTGTYGFSIATPTLASGTHSVALVYLDPLTLATTTLATRSLIIV